MKSLLHGLEKLGLYDCFKARQTPANKFVCLSQQCQLFTTLACFLGMPCVHLR